MLLLKLIKNRRDLIERGMQEYCATVKNVEINDIKVIRDAKAFAQVITLEEDILKIRGQAAKNI